MDWIPWIGAAERDGGSFSDNSSLLQGVPLNGVKHLNKQASKQTCIFNHPFCGSFIAQWNLIFAVQCHLLIACNKAQPGKHQAWWNLCIVLVCCCLFSNQWEQHSLVLGALQGGRGSGLTWSVRMLQQRCACVEVAAAYHVSVWLFWCLSRAHGLYLPHQHINSKKFCGHQVPGKKQHHR